MTGWKAAALCLTAVIPGTTFHAEVLSQKLRVETSGVTYAACVNGIRKTQQQFRDAWQRGADRDSLHNAAGHFLQGVIARDLFGYWNGTPWDFYGMSETPGCGSIACGYFVTTLLRDAGIPLDRNGLAQDYSENMIRKLLTKSSITKHVPFDCEKYLAAVKRKGNALYLLGLDNHTGFLSIENGEAWFIHSTVLPPSAVVREKADESSILLFNRYTVSGCLTRDTALLQRWMNN